MDKPKLLSHSEVKEKYHLSAVYIILKNSNFTSKIGVIS